MAETQTDERIDVLTGEVLDADHGLGQLPTVQIDGALIAGLTRVEIDIQIATAHRYKRVLSEVKREIETYATMDTETAWACNYMKPQRVKNKETGKWEDGFIEGPSVFFARIVASCMGNCRAYARRTDITDTDVEATGIFHDLEKNYALASSVRESIMTSAKGNQIARRYDDRQVTLMTNVAGAKAFRNAVLQAVPKAIWGAGYRAAMTVNKGTQDTLVERREKMFAAYAEVGVDLRTLMDILGIKGKDDVSLEVMYRAVGLLNALKDGETTVDQLVAAARESRPAPTLDEAFGKAGAGKGKPAADPKPKTADGPKSATEGKTSPPKEEGKAGAGEQTSTTTKRSDASGEKTQTATSGASTDTSDGARTSTDDAAEEGEKTDTGPTTISAAQAADADQASSDYAIGASGDSAGETSSQAQPGEASAAGEQEEEPALSEHDIAAFNTFAESVKAATSWLTIKPQLRAFRGSFGFTKAPEAAQIGTLTMVHNRAIELKDPVKPGLDPDFYECWIYQAAATEIDEVWSTLVRSPAWGKLNDAEQERLANITEGQQS